MAEPKKKPGALIAIAFGKPKKGASGDDSGAPLEDGEQEESDEGLAAAGDEVFDALKSEDREGFAAALKSFVRMAGE